MKRLTLLLFALITTLTAAFAEPETDRDRYTHTYDYENFTSLAISHAYRVELTFADNYEVRVDVPDFLEPYLIVRQRGENLLIGMERLPNDVQHKLNDQSKPIRAYVTMPKLTRLQLSGAVNVTTSGHRLALGNETFMIQLSGASQLTGLEANGQGQFDLQLSGASKADLEADFDKLLIDVSGASNLRFEGDAKELSVQCSGASKAKLDGSYDTIVAGAAGSSQLSVSGNSAKLTLELSGASRFESAGTAKWAIVELSGASQAQLTVSEQLRYDLSGVSTLKVKDLGAQVKGEISRGSKLKYLP